MRKLTLTLLSMLFFSFNSLYASINYINNDNGAEQQLKSISSNSNGSDRTLIIKHNTRPRPEGIFDYGPTVYISIPNTGTFRLDYGDEKKVTINKNTRIEFLAESYYPIEDITLKFNGYILVKIDDIKSNRALLDLKDLSIRQCGAYEKKCDKQIHGLLRVEYIDGVKLSNKSKEDITGLFYNVNVSAGNNEYMYDRLFKPEIRIGQHAPASLYFNGNHYSLHILKDGRVAAFHPM